ncbi:MAG: hypothetical protein WCI88_06915 [Chloroflexota bacterium]|jgi:uncharacterized membrane protein YeaQ/YmgE (transglycosylase-associated protein family)
MHLPAVIFGFILASFYGTLAHLIFGGHLGRLFFFIITSWVGFWAGHFASEKLGWSLFDFKPVAFDFATLGSAIFIILAVILTSGGNEQKE